MKNLLAALLASLICFVATAQEAGPGMAAHPGSATYKNIFSNGNMNFRSFGTSTSGSQFAGTGLTAYGDFNFYKNGSQVFQVTDNWWNPNVSWQGPPTAWLVASSGALAGGPDNIAVLGCKSSLYGPGTPNTATGCSQMFMPQGTSGEIHFSGNGGIGEVSIAPPQGTNPNGTDNYALANALWLSGSFTGSNRDVVIYTQYATNTAPDNTTGMVFYNQGSGGYRYLSSNTFSSIFEAKESSAADINGIIATSAPTGSTPNFSVGAFNGFSTSDTNVGINLIPSGNGAIGVNGHFASNLGPTSVPGTPTSCGTGSPSVSGTDMRGTITTGTAATACTLPFGTTYSSAPFCVVSDDSLVGFASVTSTSTTNMVLGISATLSGAKITYHCIQ